MGNRTLGGNWRTSSVANTNVFSKDTLNTNQEQVEGKLKEEIIVEEYIQLIFKTTSNNASCH
jgi:hypothetical protein